MPTDSNESILGPKFKSQVLEAQSAIFIDKNQRTLDEETKASGKLMADNLGSMVTAAVGSNEYLKLELLGAWEPLNSKCS